MCKWKINRCECPVSYCTEGLNKYDSLEVEYYFTVPEGDAEPILEVVCNAVANGFKIEDGVMVRNLFNTPDSTDFFDYCVNSLDKHHSFLRSRFYKREEALKDYEINPDINRVLCAFDNPFDISYLQAKGHPELKMQIVFTYESELESERELCKELGFPYGYVLNTHTSEVTSLGYLK